MQGDIPQGGPLPLQHAHIFVSLQIHSPEPSSLSLGGLIHSHDLKHHIYADNIHIYITSPKL